MGRLMAIDYGDVRIGIAMTDPMQISQNGEVRVSRVNRPRNAIQRTGDCWIRRTQSC